MGDEARLKAATIDNVHHGHPGLPGNPNEGIANEKVIWKGTTWRNGLFSWCCCSQDWWTITNRRIDVATGCCKADLDTLDLRRVVDLRFHRSCGQLLCCRGTLIIIASESGENEYRITTWGMKEVYEELRDAWLAVRQNVATYAPGGGSTVS